MSISSKTTTITTCTPPLKGRTVVVDVVVRLCPKNERHVQLAPCPVYMSLPHYPIPLWAMNHLTLATILAARRALNLPLLINARSVSNMTGFLDQEFR